MYENSTCISAKPPTPIHSSRDRNESIKRWEVPLSSMYVVLYADTNALSSTVIGNQLCTHYLILFKYSIRYLVARALASLLT